MRKKINCKCYDTKTGTAVCQTPKGYLYRKYHSIEYFLFDGKNIIPIPMTEARELCSQHGTKAQFDALFVPTHSQGRTNIDLTRESYSKLRICAQLHGRTVKAELMDLIEKAYRNRDRHKTI